MKIKENTISKAFMQKTYRAEIVTKKKVSYKCSFLHVLEWLESILTAFLVSYVMTKAW